MRDDIIIYEDWKIGNVSHFNFRNTQVIDLMISLVFCFLNFYLGLKLKSGLLIFTWLFGILIIILIEGIMDQKSRTITERMLVVFTLGSATFLVTPVDSSINLTLIQHISGLLLVAKIIVMLISNTTVDLADNVLIPKTENVRMQLLDQIKRLESTEFEIESTEELTSSINQIRISILKTLLFSIMIILIFEVLIFIDNYMTRFINYILSSIIILLSGVSLTSILVSWNIIKRRKLSDQIEELPELHQVFPSIE